MSQDTNPTTELFLSACQECGIEKNEDYNGEKLFGASVSQTNTFKGVRCGTGVSYLMTAAKRPNLTYVMLCYVDE